MTPEELETIAANSFFDFHAKGLDYICLKRSRDGATHKVYFLPENRDGIVSPHDHRYDFRTQLLAGEVVDQHFWSTAGDTQGRPYIEHDWFTPLNGGRGFSEVGEPVRLYEPRTASFHATRPSDFWTTPASFIHTLRPLTSSVIYLVQGPRLRDASKVYVRAGQPTPSLDGLYRKPSVDEVRARLHELAPLLGGLTIAPRPFAVEALLRHRRDAA